MATITRVERTATSRTVDTGAIGRASAGFDALAQATTAVAASQERIEVASAKAEVAKANSDLNLGYRERFNENKRSFENDPKAGQDAFNNSLDSLSQSTRGSLTSDRAKTMFDTTSLKIQEQYKAKRIDWEDKRITANVFKNIEQTLESGVSQAYQAGKDGDFDAFITNLGISQDVIVAASGTVSPDKIEELSQKNTSGQVKALMDGLIRDNVEQAIPLIESGRLDEFTTQQERDKFTDKAVKKVKNIAASLEKMRLNQPFAWLQETTGATAPEIRLNDPNTLEDRSEFVATQRELHPDTDIPLLSENEVKDITRAIDNASPDEITGILDVLNTAAPIGFADDMAEQLFADKPSYGIAMSMVGQDAIASRDIIRGQQIIDAKSIPLPTDGAIVAAINEQLRNAIGDPNMVKQIAQATKALYAAKVFDDGSDDPSRIDDNSSIFEEALKSVIGDVAEINDNKTVTFRDSQNRTVEADDFEDAFDDMTDSDFGRTRQILPLVGGKLADAEFIKRWGKLVAIGDGSYRIHLRTNNTYMTDRQGNPYVFDFKAIYNSNLKE